jgi:quercetin dioxygenase-like cupin family protein
MSTTLTPAPVMLHRAAGTGPTFRGPGDLYTFLVTGRETGGAYFAMEAFIPPGGGPPPHVHRDEDETFYVLEGTPTIVLGDRRVAARPGDFVSVPRGSVHHFVNEAADTARMILTFTPAGIEGFFEETLERARAGDEQGPMEPVDVVAARYAEAAPRYGMTFL